MTWEEVRCDHLDEIDLFWRVDAWKTDDDCEEGKVIAYIDDLTGRVLYIDPLARTDELAQEVIMEKVRELDDGISVYKRDSGHLGVEVKTQFGTLFTEIETRRYQRMDDDAVFTGIKVWETGSYIDLIATRVDAEKVSLYEWSDPHNEDWERKAEISISDIRDAVKNS